jgi:hypothetical protein
LDLKCIENETGISAIDTSFRVFPEKLTTTQLLKKFPVIWGIQRFIAVFIRDHHLPVS